MGDEIVELSTEKNISKSKKGDYDEKWLKETRAKQRKGIKRGKRTKFPMAVRKRQ